MSQLDHSYPLLDIKQHSRYSITMTGDFDTIFQALTQIKNDGVLVPVASQPITLLDGRSQVTVQLSSVTEPKGHRPRRRIRINKTAAASISVTAAILLASVLLYENAALIGAFILRVVVVSSMIALLIGGTRRAMRPSPSRSEQDTPVPSKQPTTISWFGWLDNLGRTEPGITHEPLEPKSPTPHNSVEEPMRETKYQPQAEEWLRLMRSSTVGQSRGMWSGGQYDLLAAAYDVPIGQAVDMFCDDKCAVGLLLNLYSPGYDGSYGRNGKKHPAYSTVASIYGNRFIKDVVSYNDVSAWSFKKIANWAEPVLREKGLIR